MQENIGDLEQRYQILFGDYQAGKIDEATFIAEVDRLQFRDEWGRYWMLGAQTGAWHYYDGHAWHQANPAEADKLPFLDDEGRYWQKGIKSGGWYYYDSTSGEWVKSGQDAPTPAQVGQWSAAPSTAPQPSYDYQPPAYSQQGAEASSQFEAELFQDDEGRYWTVGAKTGQWYFYDHDGWHPSHEFQNQDSFQAQPAYTPQPRDSRPTQIYKAQPQPKNPKPQPGASKPQPRQVTDSRPFSPAAQPYMPAPGMGGQPSYEQPVYQQPAPGMAPPAANYAMPPAGQASPGGMPVPPGAPSQSGSWFYFDGSQWLKYATNEPASETPPDPRLILDQETEKPKVEQKPAPKAKVETKSEPVVAEFFEENEPPVEVVDVEVITVIEPEPDHEDEVPIPSRSTPMKAAPTPGVSEEDVRPRRSRTSTNTPGVQAPSSFTEPSRQPRHRPASTPVTPSLSPQARATGGEAARSVSPRRRPAAQEPTVIIPTGGMASGISSASSKPSRPSRPIQPDPRRAREITAPMPPAAAPIAEKTETAGAARNRQVTQAMAAIGPGVANVPTSRAATGQMKATPRAKTQEKIDPAAAVVPPTPVLPQKEGYTFGAALRSFPSTIWAFAAGLAVLLVFAVVLIIGGISLGNDGDTFGLGSVALANATPTLGATLSDSTPTPGPTPSTEPDQPVATPTGFSMATFSSPDLGITLDYPEDWEFNEEAERVIFSPSEAGLDVDEPEDISLWIGIPDENSSTIPELLTSTLDQFPEDVEILNEGTISIAGQTWSSTQIRFDDENLGGQGIATVAVTNKDGKGYVLVALAPAEEWNSVQPLFQGVINSFRFAVEEVTAAKTGTRTASAPAAGTTPSATGEAAADDDEEESEDEEEAGTTPTPRSTPTPEPPPTPETVATPLVYAIQPGDSLLEIANRFGVNVDLLTTENGIDNPSGLQIGQELVIPFTAEQLAAYNEGREVPAAASSSSSSSAAEAEATEEDEEPEATTGAASAEAEAEEAEAEEAPAPEPAAEAAPVSGRIVYPAYNPGISSYDIWMVDLASGEQTPIAGNASQPTFNRDGSLLAYRSWERSTRGIFFRDFIGGRGGIVTRFVEDGLPAWAPDGYSFVFASRKEGDRVPRVYVGNQQGENPVAVGFQGEYPSAFPDGRIVAKGCLPSGDCGMFVMGARGGGEKKISGESLDTAPAVSPDGNKVAFMSSGRGGRNWEIWVMGADGSNPQRLTENGNNDGLPTWAPDGKSIAYVSDQGGVWAVWAMNADGSNQRKLFNMKGSPDGKVLHDEFNSRGWLEERISWAP